LIPRGLLRDGHVFWTYKVNRKKNSLQFSEESLKKLIQWAIHISLTMAQDFPFAKFSPQKTFLQQPLLSVESIP
jgi:hypothetical protein